MNLTLMEYVLVEVDPRNVGYRKKRKIVLFFFWLVDKR